ncbi:MAG: Uma2 family endonuclease [Bryobacterales bacterium]|nr:Uma2 family endonuclease [Bryobacterales bacterium]
MATATRLTIDEYSQLPDTGVRTELVDGEVIELAVGNWLHNTVRDETRAALTSLGTGSPGAETEFRTINERVRRADVVWFAPGRLVESDWSRNIMPVPDLAVEVVSPNDSATGVRNKVHEYLDAGVITVWLIYTDSREADIWNRGHRNAVAGADTLTADCLPGFSLPVANLFPAHISPR